MISTLVMKMWRSGYNEEDIICFVRGGVGRFEKLEERVARGERPRYRDRKFKEDERWRKKISDRLGWSKSKSVLFLPLSNKLKEVAQESISRHREDIKIVERGGRTLKSWLQRSDPCRNSLCKDLTCWICTVEEGGQKNCIKGGCHLKNVGYVITCLDCQLAGIDRRYEGESKREARVRAMEHMNGLRLRQPTSSLYKHAVEEHGGIIPNFRFQVRSTFDDPLYRQLEEGARIEESEEECLINTKSEWVPPLLSRMTIT